MSKDRAQETGYAAAAAMLAAAGFALVAAQIARTSRSELAGASAEATHQRLVADAQAGFALAIDGLSRGGPDAWSYGREPHDLEFGGAHLTVVVEDERGKVPLNTLTAPQVLTMFKAAGASDAQAGALSAAFLDWRDPNRAGHASSVAPASREGGFSTIYDLRRIPGMNEDLFAALAPSVTVNTGDSPFDARNATPLALEVMTGADAGSVKGIELRRELSGERTALSTDSPGDPHAHALTVRVSAQTASGDRAHLAYLIELTGASARPYVVRSALP